MTSTVFVYTLNGGKGKWGTYTFPFSVDAFAQLADDLYIRSGDTIRVVSEQATTDEVAGVPVDIPGTVQWGFLDLGQPGVNKMLEGFDVVGSGTPSVSVGYDQRNLAAFTEPYAVDGDTVPGDIIPLPVVAPSLSVKVTFPAAPWTLNALNLYVHDERGTT